MRKPHARAAVAFPPGRDGTVRLCECPPAPASRRLLLYFAESDSPIPALRRAGATAFDFATAVLTALAMSQDVRALASAAGCCGDRGNALAHSAAQDRQGTVRLGEVKEEARACPRRGTLAEADSFLPVRPGGNRRPSTASPSRTIPTRARNLARTAGAFARARHAWPRLGGMTFQRHPSSARALRALPGCARTPAWMAATAARRPQSHALS